MWKLSGVLLGYNIYIDDICTKLTAFVIRCNLFVMINVASVYKIINGIYT